MTPTESLPDDHLLPDAIRAALERGEEHLRRIQSETAATLAASRELLTSIWRNGVFGDEPTR